MASNFDRFLPDWQTGTLTITSGSKAFSATGAMLQLAPVRMGDTIITPSGLTLIIDTVAADGNSGTLMANSPVTATFPTLIRFQSDNSRYTGQTSALVHMLSGGNLMALNGVAGGADKMPYFTGTGTMDVTALTALARATNALNGVNGNVVVQTGAGTAASRPIVGNVSQSGGVPTGAIVQRGSNANGEFVRYADGTQICWSGLVQASHINGTALRGTWSFPSNFIAPAACGFSLVSPWLYNNTSLTPQQILANGGTSFSQRFDSSASFTLDIGSPAAGAWTPGDYLQYYAVAIGRWF